MNTLPYVTKRGYPQMQHRLDRMYTFIIQFKKLNDGNTPTLREMGGAIGVRSTSLVTYYLDSLEAAGLIRRENHRIFVIGGKWSVI